MSNRKHRFFKAPTDLFRKRLPPALAALLLGLVLAFVITETENGVSRDIWYCYLIDESDNLFLAAIPDSRFDAIDVAFDAEFGPCYLAVDEIPTGGGALGLIYSWLIAIMMFVFFLTQASRVKKLKKRLEGMPEY